MSKKKNIKEESIKELTETLSKKEQYDLNKKKKEKSNKKKETKTSKKKKTPPKNLGAKIFAILMLILMIASVLVSIFAYL